MLAKLLDERKKLKSWQKVLIGVVLAGWLLTPGVMFGMNLGLVAFQVVLKNPIEIIIDAYNQFKPKSDAELNQERINQEIRALEQRNFSPWPRDAVRMYHPKV